MLLCKQCRRRSTSDAPSCIIGFSRLTSRLVPHRPLSMPPFTEATISGPPPSSELLFGARVQSLVFASGREISSATLFPLLHLGGWIAFGFVPFAWTINTWGLRGALLDNAWSAATGALVTLGLRIAYQRARRAKVSYLVLAPVVLVTCAVLAEVWYLCDLLVVRWAFARFASVGSLHAQFAFGADYLNRAPLRIPFGQWLIYSFALLSWSSLYFCINSMLALELEKARVAHALKLADSARLRVLQAQLNPHFLFNALNGVATLIRENKGPTAANMVSTLSDFLRATLRTVNVPEIPVFEELVFIDQYIELQQLRFADRLEVSVDAAEETYSALVPTLILQPLVENAVQHGVLTQERGGLVSISIKKCKQDLLLTVEDDGPGPAESTPQRFGIGLTNTAERLRTLYGEGAAMSIGRSMGGGCIVELRLPFRENRKLSVMSTTTAEVS
jgi:two-component system, LytTR family, sensor kinase